MISTSPLTKTYHFTKAIPLSSKVITPWEFSKNTMQYYIQTWIMTMHCLKKCLLAKKIMRWVSLELYMMMTFKSEHYQKKCTVKSLRDIALRGTVGNLSSIKVFVAIIILEIRITTSRSFVLYYCGMVLNIEIVHFALIKCDTDIWWPSEIQLDFSIVPADETVMFGRSGHCFAQAQRKVCT